MLCQRHSRLPIGGPVEVVVVVLGQVRCQPFRCASEFKQPVPNRAFRLCLPLLQLGQTRFHPLQLCSRQLRQLRNDFLYAHTKPLQLSSILVPISSTKSECMPFDRAGLDEAAAANCWSKGSPKSFEIKLTLSDECTASIMFT